MEVAEEKRITLRVSAELHKRAKLKSVELAKPLSDIVRELITEWLESDPAEDKPPHE